MRVSGTSIRATARKRYREPEVYWDWAVSVIREPRIRSCFLFFISDTVWICIHGITIAYLYRFRYEMWPPPQIYIAVM
jgi:hypothetical protein